MRDIPHDIMQAAYAAVATSGIKLAGTAKRDMVVLIVAQSIAAERDRARSHVDEARKRVRQSGDGEARRVIENVTTILDQTYRAVAEGLEP